MRTEHINVGDELYYANSTRSWRLRPPRTEWGRAVVTSIGQHHNRTFVVCDLTLWRWNGTNLTFEPGPHVMRGQKVAVRYFRGPWRQTFDMTNDEAVKYRTGLDEAVKEHDRQRSEDRAVANRANLIGLTVTPFGPNGTIVISTRDLAVILDHLAAADVRFNQDA